MQGGVGMHNAGIYKRQGMLEALLYYASLVCSPYTFFIAWPLNLSAILPVGGVRGGPGNETRTLLYSAE